ncbi:MAG: helix-turn-helix domain-containing protein [Chitinophagales bacterium]|nr:helix-turn-helix domain-containing protein [Chitinophagales bacterium]
MGRILFIKNMCCERCVATIENILTEIGQPFSEVKIGEIRVEEEISEIEINRINDSLVRCGFSLVDKPAAKTVVQIQALLCEYVRAIVNNSGKMQKLSTYIESNLHRSYYHLSKTFSSETGLTIEKYFLALKMEKAKELILEDKLSLSSIGWQLGYTSSQTFSTQFKKVTGLTPGAFKLNPNPPRKAWDKLLPQDFEQS